MDGIYLVEVGCIGESSLHNFLTPNVRLDIIEPIPKNIQAIEECYKDFPNVTVYPFAIWKESCTLEMYDLERVSYVKGIDAPATGSYRGMAEPGRPTKLSYEPKDSDLIKVEAKTFDQFDNGKIDVLDLDVEGAEWYVLEKMISRPKIVIVETGADRDHPFISDIDNWALENGYVEFRHYESNSWFKRT